jgi:L-alanine-DL-glutamate epimerase-like enolase superfamily enzyme
MRELFINQDSFRIDGKFVISRGSKIKADVIIAAIEEDGFLGRGECVPYSRYGETLESVIQQMESVRDKIKEGADRFELQTLLPAGAARNALDCALWDLAAKRIGMPAYQLAGLHRLSPVTTAFTISLGTPFEMAAAATKARDRPLLKIKLGGAGDVERIAAVRAAAPLSELIVDANEAWNEADLTLYFDACAQAGVALIEQPLPAGQDEALAKFDRIIPVCADESVHDRRGLQELRTRYDAINVKLDKTGGLTEALALSKEAQELGYFLVIGCMVASSLAMAPAMLLTPQARFVDLDGPLLLAQDRKFGLIYDHSVVYPPMGALWG